MENITNNIASNLAKSDLKASKANIAGAASNSVEVKNEGSEKIVNIDSSKGLVAKLASSAPIDADKVANIKEAISSGNYPLDMDKITDALMQAYREMKS